MGVVVDGGGGGAFSNFFSYDANSKLEESPLLQYYPRTHSHAHASDQKRLLFLFSLSLRRISFFVYR